MKIGTTAQLFAGGTEQPSVPPEAPDLFGEVAAKAKRKVVAQAMPQQSSILSIYEMYRQMVMEEVNLVFESTSSKRVRVFIAQFEEELQKARKKRKDPTSIFQKVMAALRQGDFADPNRKGFTIRKLKQRESDQLNAERSEAEEKEPKVKHRWKDVPTWAEIEGEGYVSQFGHRSGSDTTPAASTTASTVDQGKWLQDILDHCRKPQEPRRVIEIKAEGSEPDSFWYRICDFGGFFCVDEMWGTQVMNSELRENVSTVLVVNEFRTRLAAERASAPPAGQDEPDVGDLSPAAA